MDEKEKITNKETTNNISKELRRINVFLFIISLWVIAIGIKTFWMTDRGQSMESLKQSLAMREASIKRLGKQWELVNREVQQALKNEKDNKALQKKSNKK